MTCIYYVCVRERERERERVHVFGKLGHNKCSKDDRHIISSFAHDTSKLKSK